MKKITGLSSYHPQDNRHLVKRDLDNASAPIEKVVEQSHKALDQALDRRDSFLQKLFPNQATREIIKGELALVKTEFEFRKIALEKVRETQIQSLTEVCNQYLVRQKAEIRGNTAQFLMSKAVELQQEMDRLLEQFMAQMEINFEKLESIKNPILRKTRELQLERDLEGFMEQQALLMERFQRIVSEGV
jgi:endonuclease III-like uncharacterized protein